jgi:hypothetical protein
MANSIDVLISGNQIGGSNGAAGACCDIAVAAGVDRVSILNNMLGAHPLGYTDHNPSYNIAVADGDGDYITISGNSYRNSTAAQPIAFGATGTHNLVTDQRPLAVSVSADTLAIPVTHEYVKKTTGGDGEALTLANGRPGQLLTIQLVVDGGGDGTLTPTTAEFTNIVFADAGDTATLKFLNSTTGWIIVGLAGGTAPPVVTP